MSDTFIQINKIETFIYRVSGAADVLEVMASECSEDPTSGALWYLRDTLKTLVEQAELDIEEIYSINRQMQEKPKKGKK